eukprot:TRINITY_DN12352_c0_g1_i1.p1 TRINITY_DN12352_c0_g1~~TRINITY_DN12352_c0_g1_i1.p1  ORF type:complete len:500 (+),score=83.15 TRINITY_DN12352_c0_g1_i1:28-1500(+)
MSATPGAEIVKLHVYDLSRGMARMMSQQLLGTYIEGIWHTGIVVYGREYYWGGNLQQDRAGQTSYGIPTKVETLGETFLPKEVFDDWVNEVSPNYTIESYHLLDNNCNNFTNEASTFLTGNPIPAYVKNLPDHFLSTPAGMALKPIIEMYQGSVKASMGYTSPVVTPTPARAAQPAPVSAAAAPAPVASPAPSPAAVPKSPASNQSKKHIMRGISERKPLLAVAVPQNLAPTFAQIKSLIPASDADDSKLLDDIQSWMTSLATQPQNPAPAHAGNLVTRLLQKCTPNEAFHLLLVTRLLVVSSSFVKTIPNMHDFIDALVSKHMGPKVIHRVKIMALVILSNMFATARAQLLTDKALRSAIIERTIKFLRSKKSTDLRMTAAGLLLNFAMFWPADEEDEMITIECAICDNLNSLQEFDASSATTELVVRLLSALGYLILSSPVCAEMAVSLDAGEQIDRIAKLSAGKSDSRVGEVCAELNVMLSEAKANM